jgi:hypothetical protein
LLSKKATSAIDQLGSRHRRQIRFYFIEFLFLQLIIMIIQAEK